MNTKPTHKQLEILTQLYRYTYLDRTQIQQLLKHSKHNRIQTWLNTLTSQNLITKHYIKTIQSRPASYTLTSEGRQIVRQHYKDKNKRISLTRQITDNQKLEHLRDHYLQVAKICLTLMAQGKDEKVTVTTKTELKGIKNLLSPRPDSYVLVEKAAGETSRYFLEVFDDIPTTRIRARVRKYLDYYESDQWQDNSDKPFPVITFVCPNKRVRSHVSYFLASRVDEETGPEVTTVLAEEISSKGLGAVQAVR